MSTEPAAAGADDAGETPDRARRTRSRARFEARQREIVDIAARLFADRGYHATSVDDLTAATGLQRGGLYHYIGSKEALLFRIHERFIAPLLEAAREIEQRDEPAEQRLRALARALMRDIADYQPQVTVFIQEWRTIRADPRAGELVEARRAFEAVLERVLADGVAEGTFRLDDARLAQLGFLGMFNYSYQWFRSSGGVPPEQVADRFCDVFLDGIRAR
ncbi:MAG: TetR/AcrR family transcriptional regulator [Thermoleophilia bacterium]